MLKISNLSSRYAQVKVLNKVTLKVKEGEILGLLGRNGAGKSTLLKSIMGLVEVVSGSISLDENILSEQQAHNIPKYGIGYVPQGRRLFPELMVEENLKMGLLVRDSSTNVLDWVLSLFPLLKSRMKQKSGTLSGGEQQMVATARALCLQPKYLLMDEPSEGLMPSMTETILETVEKLKTENVGILLVEQKIEGTLRVSDRIVFMENGSISEESDPQKLAENPESLMKYVGVKARN